MVAISSKNTVKRWILRYTEATSPTSRSSIQLAIPMENNTWLSKAWVGRLKNLATFDRLEEELKWDGGEDIKPKYLGGDMVLLMGLNDTRAEDLCRGVESRLSMFHTLEK